MASGAAVAEQLQGEERSGAPATFELGQVLHLVKIAYDSPRESNRPISQWMNRELADELVQ